MLVPLLGLLLASPTADETAAKALFEEGVQFTGEQRWDAALNKFEASWALVERASTMFNIGTVLLRLDRPTEAIEAFDRFLEIADDADENRSNALEKKREAEAALPPPPTLPVPDPPVRSTVAIAPPVRADVPDEDSDNNLVLWGVVVGGAVVITAAVIIGVAAGSSTEPPFPGSADRVLRGLVR